MAIKIVSAVRLNPAPCKHYVVTIEDDGVRREFRTSLPELREALEETTKKDLVLGWIKYKVEKGATLSSLINVVIA